ncbi:arylamine N-acetyltransferase family protein [Shimwellia blattae]|uniref:N-hydroxyarylamine O-acetyltransferase n=1 Tax=Shimwellia blattae (strain ATCC 29907 / DSM 4481 / JCM 1650 / NBRC 105725 / CDC 9005-74) TaxID=630626 RepID=I2B994_SHIBC|nr:arylamine N-acetyltransferase [Shimwellia blattae]AFJ47098.1 N-hydroxyarylamine O-acetyltransferase [Shimwellia blattae DSM 4481 = NBRC 105725]GAB80780.1 N-hydroxyarylamine O-acetyltransferase [Shimwellia blattae DSM 4481 = NBRC 105725]VDY64591.1 N-hydroxyarylamine O-acetyltransferase [Shimwellia blattae]VEC22699.1 N-hydroxyarylamine O-acetyltransferase [Shimwellia blattae]
MHFSREAYLARIGYQGEVAADLATLKALHLHHCCAIAFENLDVLLGREISVDPGQIFSKLVTAGRGGYCYEQNGLFEQALADIGFEVRGLNARVLVSQPLDMPGRTHRLNLVELNGSRWIADVGFGGATLTAPLRLDDTTIQATPHGRYRLGRSGADFVLFVACGGQWHAQYRFDTTRLYPADDEMANFYTANWPGSHFRHHLLLALQHHNGERTGAVNQRITRHTPRESQQQQLDNNALYDALSGRFGLRLDDPHYGISREAFLAMMARLEAKAAR